MSAPTEPHVVAVIAARGGSKGIPRKNLLDFCGKPLVAWTIEQALGADAIREVWLSSDDREILEVGESFGARPIVRPPSLADDASSSEEAWEHALGAVEIETGDVDLVCALQATSPLRESADVDAGVTAFHEQGCDSLFSASGLDDFFVWEKHPDGELRAVNYDPGARGRRQDRTRQYVENGSFYLFRREALRQYGNRLSGRVGASLMDFWKSFEIDDRKDIAMCEALMRRFLL